MARTQSESVIDVFSGGGGSRPGLVDRPGRGPATNTAAAHDSRPRPPDADRTRRPRPATVLLAGCDAAVAIGVAVLGGAAPLEVGLLLGLLGGIAWSHGYRSPLGPWWLDGLPTQMRVMAVPVAAYVLLAGTGHGGGARFAAIAVAALSLSRLVMLSVIRVARTRGRLREGAVIVGRGVVANSLSRSLAQHPQYGIDVVGYVDVDDQHPPSGSLPYLGYVQELDAVLVATGAQRVIVTFLSTSDHHLVELLRWTASHHVDVHVVPRLFEVSADVARVKGRDHVFGIPLVPLAATPHGSVRWVVKRGFDIVVSVLAVLLLLPMLIGLAAGVRLTSPGPALFRQTRIGMHGRPFALLKFRSMQLNDDSDHRWSVEGDRRVTALGRFMRKWSLDELPQLLNVVKGDMSLVGPRPERPTFVDEFSRSIPAYGARHRVPVGVTGWAQVHGLRGDTSIEDRARFDNAYVEQWSLWRDVVILLRTVGAVIRHPG